MGKKKSLSRRLWTNIMLLLAFVSAIICCAAILRNILWESANEMGFSLVKNYSSAEEQNIKACEIILNICTDYVAERERAGISPAEFHEGLYPFMRGLTDIYGEDEIQMYGWISGGGTLVSLVPEIEAMTAHDVEKQAWYQGAAAADGGIYISPIYTDLATGLPVVTMCRMIPETGSFLAIDMKPSCFELSSRDIVLPDVSSYFLVDREGDLLYYLSSWNYRREEMQNLVDSYRENAVHGEMDHVSENVRGPDGIVRNVFFHHMQNGWTGILTIPREAILSGSVLFRNISFILIAFGVILILNQIIREYKSAKREDEYQIYQKAMTSTARACRVIYYIDINKGTMDTVYPLGADGKPRHSSYDREVADCFKHGVVAEEHCEMVADFLDMSNLKKRLAERDHIEFQFKRSMFDVNKRENRGEVYEWCSISVTVAEKRGGKLSAITMAIRSIDDVIRREEEQKQILALAVARAEAASRAKSDFLSRMSHDIRTPMNAILGMTSIAAMHIDEKGRVLDALDKITVSGKHLLGLINDVLDMSRIESGKVSLTEENFNLSGTIDNMLTVFHSQVEAKQLKLDVRIAKIEHENVIGDEQHLQQIFMNIMGNAVKFTPLGGSITIYIEEKPSHIGGRGCYEFAFEDTGIGMEPEFIETIFEPFSRAVNSSGNKIEGTGLGMSIAINVARMMDGDIKVESTPGRGSKFTVMVHLKLDDTELESMDSLFSLPVLVVDDEEDACKSACEILCSLGMDAEYVLDGDSAVRRVAEAAKEHEEFSVVILDWKMPGKDGLETAKEIRRTVGEHIPIIILSAYDWTDIEAEAREAGIDTFISKPMFKSKLIRVLQDVLGQNEGKEISNALEAFKQQDYSGKRVLLAEDNEINIEVAQELLQMVGIQAEPVMNGQLALERMLEKEPGYYDLIFMDIQMPVMNGYEAAQAIRSAGREDLKKIPIIAMTADAFSDDIRKSKEAGMNDHISKPVDLERLETVMQKWIIQVEPAAGRGRG